jgi:hypothetical protein
MVQLISDTKPVKPSSAIFNGPDIPNPGLAETIAIPRRSERPINRIVPERLKNLRGIILLEGSVRGTPLAECVNRSMLELPVANGRTILDVWRQEIRGLAEALNLPQIPCCVLVGKASKAPHLSKADLELGMIARHDSSEFRGTAGVLRDLVVDAYEDNAQILVLTASQLLFEPLVDLAMDAAELGGDITVTSHRDGSPTNLFLIRCGILKQIPDVGFVDLKEQGLIKMAAKCDVTVLLREHGTAIPLRSLKDYISAVRAYNRMICGKEPRPVPLEERWASSYAIVEPSAIVEANVILHDSVVLAGGKVGQGATVIQSVVGFGGIVPQNGRMVDSLVNPAH